MTVKAITIHGDQDMDIRSVKVITTNITLIKKIHMNTI